MATIPPGGWIGSNGVVYNSNGTPATGTSSSTQTTSSSSNLPPIPASVYSTYANMVGTGQISAAMATQQLQSMLGNTYSGTINTSLLFPQGQTFTNAQGQTSQFDNSGSGTLIKTSPTVNSSNTNNNTGTTTAGIQVTLGNGQTVYVNSQGQYSDANGNPLTNAQVSGATAGTAPITSSSTGTGSSTSTTNTTGNGPVITPTGNSSLDAATGPLAKAATNAATNGQLPANLQITPDITAQFLSWAQAYVDPQTQSLLQGETAQINEALNKAQADYQTTLNQSLQSFGMNLLGEQNTAGQNGMTSSGMRNLQESNLVNSTNWQLQQAAADAAAGVGTTLNTGAAAVGGANANMFNLPNMPGAPTVSNLGGQTGSITPNSNTLNFGYTPSNYITGTIPSQQALALTNQQQNYENQYYNLAVPNPTLSQNQILGQITNVPAGQNTTVSGGGTTAAPTSINLPTVAGGSVTTNLT